MSKTQWEKLGEGILVALLVYFVTVFIAFDPNAVTDWHSWGVGLLSGAVRVVASAAATLLESWRSSL